MDDLDGAQPRCGSDGIVMRDIDGGWRCPSCGEILAPVMPMRTPPRFNGPAILGG
jgi:ribosomal protein L37AE/L43A